VFRGVGRCPGRDVASLLESPLIDKVWKVFLSTCWKGSPRRGRLLQKGEKPRRKKEKGVMARQELGKLNYTPVHGKKMQLSQQWGREDILPGYELLKETKVGVEAPPTSVICLQETGYPQLGKTDRPQNQMRAS